MIVSYMMLIGVAERHLMYEELFHVGILFYLSDLNRSITPLYETLIK